MNATAERCGARTFDGVDYRRCTRPASSARDGMAVCKQHARLARVTWAGAQAEAVVSPVVAPDRRWWLEGWRPPDPPKRRARGA